MNKVVKCNHSKCRLFFTYTEKDTKCPFCKTEYGEAVEDKTKDFSISLGAGKKETKKTQKESFKIWKDN